MGQSLWGENGEPGLRESTGKYKYVLRVLLKDVNKELLQILRVQYGAFAGGQTDSKESLDIQMFFKQVCVQLPT